MSHRRETVCVTLILSCNPKSNVYPLVYISKPCISKRFAEEYIIKTAAALQSVIEMRNTANKNNVKTVRDRNTTAEILEAVADSQMETTTTRRAILKRSFLKMARRMRMGRGEGVKGRDRNPNGSPYCNLSSRGACRMQQKHS